jgi:hypothetical protein
MERTEIRQGLHAVPPASKVSVETSLPACPPRPARHTQPPRWSVVCARLCLILLLTGLALLAVPGRASATVLTWTGMGDGTSWADPANWSPQQVPSSDDELTVRRLPGGPMVVTLPAGAEIGKLTLAEGGTLTGGSIRVTKEFTWLGGTLATAATLAQGTTTTISGSDVKDLYGSLTLNGTATADGSGAVRLFGSSTITNAGQFTAKADVKIQGMVCCISPSRFVNSGTLSVVPLLPVIPGAVQIAAVSLEQRGIVDVAANGTLELSIAPSSFLFGSAFAGAGRTLLVNTFAPATLDGVVVVGPGSTFEVGAGAELTGTGTVTGAGTMTWSGGELQGTFTVAQGTTLHIMGTETKQLSRSGGGGGELTLAGTTLAEGPGELRFSGSAVLTNSGSFTARPGLTISSGGCCVAPARLINTGTLSVAPAAGGAAGTVTITGVALDQRNLLDVASGTLDLTIAGSVFSGGSRISGAGRTRLINTFDAATITGAITLSPATTLEVAPGAELGGTGALTGGGTLVWSGGELRGSLNVAASISTMITGADMKTLATGFGGGTLTLAGPTTASGAGAVRLAGPAKLTNTGTFTVPSALTVEATVCCVSPAQFINNGTFVAKPGGTAVAGFNGVKFANAGQVRVESGSLSARLAGYRQTGGVTLLAGGTLTSDQVIDLAAGTLAGTGTLSASLASAGIVSPGAASPPDAVGVFTITGNYTQRPTGTLRADLHGPTAGTNHDQLRVGGQAFLDGTLELKSAAAFVPAPAARLDLVVSATRSGSFAKLVNASLPGNRRYWTAYTPTTATLRVMTVFTGATAATAGGEPPDTTVARTTSSVLEGNNIALRLMTPAGVVKQNKDLASFFGATAAGGDIFDPKVTVDRIGPNQRVYAVALQMTGTTDATGRSRIWLAVSRTSDPATLNAADWCRYSINGKRNAGTLQSSWADYPGIGFGADALIIATDQRTFGPELFTFAVVRAMNKLTLANNTAGCPTLPMVHTRQPSATVNDPSVRSLQPVQYQNAPATFPGTSKPAYLVSTERRTSTSNTYRLWRLRNLASGAPSLDVVLLNATTGYSQPANAPQSGGAPLQDTSDTRVTSTVGRDNTVTLAHNTGCNIGGGAVESCVRLLRLTVGQNAAGLPTATESRLTTIAGGPGDFLFHPGVAVDTSGRSAVVFLRSSATTFLGAAWTLQGLTTPNPEPLTPLAQGTCKKPSDRTGDYTGAALDPTGTTFWLAAERATTLGGVCRWDTSIAAITP